MMLSRAGTSEVMSKRSISRAQVHQEENRVELLSALFTENPTHNLQTIGAVALQ